ncbi:hypothetical protein RQP46_004004 [Phenoliferia psychrophenolica]
MSGSSKSKGRMSGLVGWRLKITLNDSRTLTGQMLAFDKHMNLVIAECEEFRRVKAKKAKGAKADDEDEVEVEMKRMLGLVILRGETIVTLSVEGPPPVVDESKGAQLSAGPGAGAPAGRGMGLQAPTMRMAPMPAGMPGMMGGPPPMGFAPPPGFPMAPPPGIQSRVSLAADPKLYADSSDEDSAAPPPLPTTSHSTSHSLSTASPSRRSTRLSAESRDALPSAAGPSTSTTTTARSRAKAAPQPTTTGPTATKKRAAESRTPTKRKGKAQAQGEAEAQEDESAIEEGEGAALGAAKGAAGATGPAKGKRPRVAVEAVPKGATTALSVGGFAPRAAVPVPRKAPPVYAEKLVRQPARAARIADPDDEDDDEDDDDDSQLRFTTHPPTPGGPKPVPPPPPTHDSANNNKRPLSPSPGNPKTKVSRSENPVASTSTSSRPQPQAYPPTPPRGASDNLAPVPIAETPVQVRNLAFRGGTGSAARRASVERRGSRGSVSRASRIGGFDAIPHPDVPDDRLYRSTDNELPVAVRLRSVLVWTSSRQRDATFVGDAGDPARRLARTIVDAFIDDLTKSRLDVAVRHQDESGAKPNYDGLPPHPQNVVNDAKFLELQDNYASIATEQAKRSQVALKYDALQARTPLPAVEDPAHFDFEAAQDLPKPHSLEEALAIGRAILKGKSPASGKGAAAKGKSKAVPTASDVLALNEAHDLGLKTAAFRLLTHRPGSFTTVASSYVQSRIQQAHGALEADARRDLDDHPGETAHNNIARVVGTSLPPQRDPRDLLRSIASVDAVKR